MEATYFVSFDVVSPSIRAIADRRCGSVNTSSVINASTKYCDILQTICRRGLEIGWTVSELRSFSSSIKNKRDHARNVFEHSQVSGIVASRWYCLENLVDSLKDVGGIVFLHAGHYESVHKVFERAYQRTFRQNGSAMKEALQFLELQSSLEKKVGVSKSQGHF